jgi:membrane-associated phospholipid phosphatase
MRVYLLKQSTLVMVVAALILSGLFAAGSSLAAPSLRGMTDQIEPKAGTWKTWVLTSGSQFRLPAPPDKAATQEEVKQLKDMAGKRTASVLDQIAYWDTGGPSYRWNQIAVDEMLKVGVAGPQFRHLALLHVAIYDAMVAAWDTKYAFNRPRPSEVDSSLETVLPNPKSPAYPSEYAVAAGAASSVLAYIFPDDAKLFTDKANEEANSRLMAGVDYPSDVKAGLELGQKVAALVIERGKADGSDAKWTGTVPTEKGKWTGKDPIAPTQGSWKTWILSSGNEFRPGPPPAYDSDQEKTELAEVVNFKRTPNSYAIANFWEFAAGGRRNYWFWSDLLDKRILEYRLDSNPPRAARAYALFETAYYDSGVACWDAKYTYWAIRPFQLDPEFKTLFTTPNHPGYPSAHSCLSGTAVDILNYLFPRDAAAMKVMLQQISESRIWAGIHFRSDIMVGLALGDKVAEKAIQRAQGDGS